MKTNSAESRDSLGIVDPKVNKKNRNGSVVKGDDKDRGSNVPGAAGAASDAVNVKVTPGLMDHLTFDELADERAKKIAEIRKQVQSGEYFSSRSITDIAQILERRMGEEIEITKIFTKDEEE